ncbi:MAG: AAA family ATPase [Thiogranum sp.]
MTYAERLDPAPDYLKTFSLKTEPFATSVDGRFFYAAAALTQRMDLLVHLTRFGDAIVLVSGPPGSGKTTLLRRFIRQTSRQWRLCALDAGDFGQFQQRLGDALGIGDGGDEQDRLQRWASRSDTSRLLVIAIDDAQELPAQAHERLFRLIDPPQGERVRLVLFGTPEMSQAFGNSLERRQPQHNIRVLDIPRLTEEETGSYLMYRLAVAGYSGENPFPATEIQAINKAADGRPAAINRLARHALEEHRIRRHTRRFRPPQTARGKLGAAWVLTSALLLASAVYFVSDRMHPSAPVAADKGGAAQTPAAAPVPPAPQPPAAAPPASDNVVSLPVPPQRQVALRYALASGGTPAALEIRAMNASWPKLLTAVDPAPLDTHPDNEHSGTDSGGTVQSGSTSEAAEEIAAPAAQPATQEAFSPAVTAPTPPAASGTTAARPTTEGTPAPPVPRSSAPAAETTRDGFPRREAWLLRQANSRYSLQLLGTRQEKTIAEYVNRYGLDIEQCAYYRGSFQGGAWYVLLYGLYPNRDAAVEARAGLPERVSKGEPWPRSLASVHSAIRDAR